MPHQLYQTEGFIVGSRGVRDGSRLLDVITRDFGRVPVFAQGVRELRSKLRYQLSNLAFIRLTLVRGREFWRLVGVEPLADFNVGSLLADRERRILVARLALILRRFLATPETSAEPQLYSEIRAAISFLNQFELSSAEYHQYELAAVWRLLAHLGYGRRTPALLAVISHPVWDYNLLTLTAACQPEIIASINEALYHSQL
ncbi:MAG: recombination protein O N-terminal domain-containing protein [Patescibacteria group bacterium]